MERISRVLDGVLFYGLCVRVWIIPCWIFYIIYLLENMENNTTVYMLKSRERLSDAGHARVKNECNACAMRCNFRR